MTRSRRWETVGDVRLDWRTLSATPKDGEPIHIGERNLVLLRFFLSKPNVPHAFMTIGQELRDNGFSIKDTSVVSTMTYFRPALRSLNMLEQFESVSGFGFRFNIPSANDNDDKPDEPELGVDGEEREEESIDEHGWSEDRLFFAEQQDEVGWSAALIAHALGKGMTASEVEAKLAENKHSSPPAPTKAEVESSVCVWLERSGFLCGAPTGPNQFFCPKHLGTAT